ncbi:MAG: Rrf2 family transcriptional regulator [Candidatus Omnitrophica bacterium]|nr:Rrf2 family transcriptional regulator [Candidatus Omnitrophota bacterium]
MDEVKLITRDTDYAIRTLCYIAKQKQKRFSVTELVKVLKIPRPFLRKIFQRLHKEGILEACKGKNGGFSLSLPAEKIFILDLMKIFQGEFFLNECLLKKKTCPNIYTCTLKKKISDIEKYLVAQLKPISIASLQIGR